MSPPTSILFVDDEPSVLSGLRRALRARADDWAMHFEADPEAALAFVRQYRPHVAVLDIRMPKMSGIQLAEEIHKSQPSTVSIILSGSTDFDVALDSINKGHVFRYYVKPCATEDLVDGIEQALRRRGRRAGDSPGKPLMDKAEVASELSAGTLDLLPYGVIVAREDAQAMFTNAAAAAVLSTATLVGLDREGRCHASTSGETDRLRSAIAAACREEREAALSLADMEGRSLHLRVQPYQSGREGAERLACLFLVDDADTRAPDPGLLAEMFDLTVSESRLASALAKGSSLDEAAQQCGITKSSARTYLKNIFSKLGVSRQAELVRKLLLASA